MSLRQVAINAKCKDCCYDELDHGTWREQVERNECGDCPLKDYKPKTIASEKRERAFLKLIRKTTIQAEDFLIR